MFIGPRNWLQGMNSASLCSLAGRYNKPIPPRFLAPIDFLKIPALITRSAILDNFRNFLRWPAFTYGSPFLYDKITLSLSTISVQLHTVQLHVQWVQNIVNECSELLMQIREILTLFMDLNTCMQGDWTEFLICLLSTVANILIFANPFCALVLVESEWIRKPTNLIQICVTIHRVNTERQIATFWRTFQNYGKISPAWWGWGVHAHPLSLDLPSRTKL